MMNRIAKIFQTDKSKKPTGPYLTGMTDSDTLGSSEPVTAASISATDTIPSVLVSAATANDQGTHTGSVTVPGLQVAASEPVSSTPSAQVTHADSVTAPGLQVSASEPVSASTVDPIPSVPADTEIESVKVIPTASATTAHELGVSDLVSTLAIKDPAPVAHPEASFPSAIIQADLGLEQNQNPEASSGLGLILNAQDLLVAGSVFDTVNIFPGDPGEGQMTTQKPKSSPFFTGRRDVLDKLGMIFAFRDGRLMSRCSCLLWGMGGIGKTQICLKFIEEMSHSFSHVFWVDASSHDSILASLKAISSIPAAKASDVDGSVESVLQWISCIQEDWLIVFDNANAPPEVVAKFFPPGNRGNILITSQNQFMGRIIASENIIEIREMDQSDAIALLFEASHLEPLSMHLEAAKDIVTGLGCIPLAVDQAGAYIAAGKCDINEYLRLFSLHCQTLMSDAVFTGASDYSQTVYRTWDLSFQEIAKRAITGNAQAAQAAQAAVLILQICTFYHHSNISKEIFRSAAEESEKCIITTDAAKKLPLAKALLDHTLLSLDEDGHWNDFVFEQGINVLLSFSLIKREQLSEILSIHPLVHAWSWDKMTLAEQQRICQIGSIILSCAIPWSFTSQDYRLRRLIFPHIKANELYANQIGVDKKYFDDRCTNFALVMMENGDWNSAEQLNMQVVSMRKKLLTADHPDTLISIASLATTYHCQGRWNEAEQLLVQVMDIEKRLLGAEHPNTLMTMANLARTYLTQGRWNEAEQLQVKVMDIRKKLLGAEHPDTLMSIADLATTYHHQGIWNKAEELQVQVMDMRKRMLGADHPETLASMGNLASIYFNQGRWSEAEHLQIQVMDMRKKLLGAEHPNTLKSIANLAVTYFNQGRWNEAEQLQVKVMNMMKKLFGAEHPDTLTSIANLAATYHCQRRWNEAEQLQVQIMDMRKKLLGAEHPDTLTSMINLASTYYQQGRWNEAEQLQVQVMDMRKKLLGEEHPNTLTSMANIAVTYGNQERWDEAEQLSLQVMNIRKKMLGPEHPDTLTCMANLATLYWNQKKLNKAEQLEVQVVEMRKKLLGADHPDTLTSMANLATLYWNQGRLKEAEQLEVQVVEMRKKLFGADHPDTFTSIANLAITYHNQGRQNESEQLK